MWGVLCCGAGPARKGCKGKACRVMRPLGAELPPVFVIRISWDGPTEPPLVEADVAGTLQSLPQTLDLGAPRLAPQYSPWTKRTGDRELRALSSL
jgi:hypothetical protein